MSCCLTASPVPHCKLTCQAKSNQLRIYGTWRQICAGLSAKVHPRPILSWFVLNTSRLAKVCDPNPRMDGVFLSASPQNSDSIKSPFHKWQSVDCRLPVRFLLAAGPCRYGTDRQKRTEHYHEYTHHFSKGLKLPMGTMVKPSSFTFRLLKSNSNSKELPKLSSTTTMKLCASSPSAV